MRTEKEVRDEIDNVQLSRWQIMDRYRWLKLFFTRPLIKLFLPIIQYAELLGQHRFGYWVLEERRR